MNGRRLCVMMVAWCCGLLLLVDVTMAFGTHLFRLGTGGRSGVYNPIGKAIAHGLTEYLHAGSGPYAEYIAVAQISAGSVENLRGIISGELEAGLVQADVATAAHRGGASFASASQSLKLRAIASLYPEKFQIVVRRDAGIRTVHDLRGKHISLDEPGSGTLAVMRIVLDAHQLSEQDLSPVYLKPAFTHDQVMSGALQGIVTMSGVPNAAVDSLLDVGVNLVPIEYEVAVGINSLYPYLVPGRIEADLYPGIGVTPTLEVYALLVVHADMADDLAHMVTAALFSEPTRRLLQQAHPLGSAITPETALKGLSIPLHPGAERFYRENNLIGQQR